LRIWRREVVDEPTVRQIRLERIWTAAGWPWSAQRGRVRPKDGPNNPSRTSPYLAPHRSSVLRIWRREVVDEPTVRQIRLERIWTAAGWPRSALARAGVWPMDGPNNPSRTSRHFAPHQSGVLHIWRREKCGRTPWFDKFVRNKFGQPQAGPGARSAEGFGPRMGRTIPRRLHATSHLIEATFCVSGRELRSAHGFDSAPLALRSARTTF
jgi:hypothetical protein